MQKLKIEQRERMLLLLLLGTDLLFMVLHLFSFWDAREHGLLSLFMNDPLMIDTDQGFAELFQYLKLSLIVVLLGISFFKGGPTAAGAWAVVFGYVLLDDAFLLHEHYGAIVANAITFPAAYSVLSTGVGELLVSGVVAVVLGMLVLFTSLVGSRANRIFSAKMFFLHED